MYARDTTTPWSAQSQIPSKRPNKPQNVKGQKIFNPNKPQLGRTGAVVGVLVGALVGVLVGALVGRLEGRFVGDFVGVFVGALVGIRLLKRAT